MNWVQEGVAARSVRVYCAAHGVRLVPVAFSIEEEYMKGDSVVMLQECRHGRVVECILSDSEFQIQ